MAHWLELYMEALSFKGAKEMEYLAGHIPEAQIGILMAMKMGRIDIWKTTNISSCNIV